MKRKISLTLLILLLLTSCLSVTESTDTNDYQRFKLKEALIDCELQALNNLNLEAIASSCSEQLQLNDTITAYSFLPQYEALVQEYKNSFTSLFNRVLVYEIPNIKSKIKSLELLDPILLLNSGYQSISWEIEKYYKAEIHDEIYTLIENHQELFLTETFKALETETMIWKTNQEVLNKVKEVKSYPTITPISLENSAQALTDTLLSELAFAEQRVRTKISLEFLYE